MRPSLLAPIGAALLLAAPAARGSTPAAPQRSPLTLDVVLESVERYHPTLLAAVAAEAAADGQRMAADGAFDPRLVASAGGRPLGYYDQARFDVAVVQATPLWGLSLEGGWRWGQGDFAAYEGKAETASGGELFARAKLPLLAYGFTDPTRIAVVEARAAQRGADAAAADALRLLRLDAAEAWWAWLLAGEARVVADDLLALAQDRDAAVRRRADVGAVAAIEVLENERAVLDRQAKALEAAWKERQAAAKLSLYLRDSAGQPWVPDPLDRPPVPTPRPPPQTGVDRPDVEALRAAQDAAQAQVRLARAAALPKLDVFAGVSHDLGSGSTALTRPVLDLGLSLDLSAALRPARGKLLAARAKAEQAAAKLALAEQKADVEVQVARAGWEAAAGVLPLAERRAEVARQLAAAEARRFELGDTSLLIVNLREQAAADAQLGALAARGRLDLAAAAWAAALGGTEARWTD